MSLGTIIRTGATLIPAGSVVGLLQYIGVKGVEKLAGSQYIKGASSELIQNHGSTIVKCVGQTVTGIGALLVAKLVYHKHWETTSTIFGENNKMVSMTGEAFAKVKAVYPDSFQE